MSTVPAPARCRSTAASRRPRSRCRAARSACCVALGLSCVCELSLASGRRADLVALAGDGEIWIVEIKSSIEDFRVDQKWPDYRMHCDRLFFATAAHVPLDIFPPRTGLIVADAYGGELVREAPEHRLHASTRKSMMLCFARAAALRPAGARRSAGGRRSATLASEAGIGGLDYFGARLARIRCRVRRCMLSRRAVSDTLRPHSS